MATVISVDGEDGANLARSSGIRLVQDDPQAVVLRNHDVITRDGQPGRNAPRAVPGGPGGTVAVRLFESERSQGAIRVDVENFSSSHRPPRSTEVAIGRDLILTAIGGNGESGHTGGDGQSGMNGANGTDATKGSDATNGTDGGSGGDAGRGSSGGNGGLGGSIHVILGEHSTHLLMATYFDVRGGKGGAAGAHGKAGAGGTGGKAGMGFAWEETVGYTYYCTDSCIKTDAHAANSNALMRVGTRAGSQLNATTRALVAQTRAVSVSGSNLQNVIAQLALSYHARRQPMVDEGACKCGGGTGNCGGCGMKPVIKPFQRAPGLGGRDGETGLSITEPLAAGVDGEHGTVTIVVHHGGDSVQRYHLPWLLELVDFEVEDENGDGVFEPGEHLFIRRIKVRNIGGMPSPTCRIAVTLAENSDWFEAVPADDGGVAFLPTSIPAHGSASTEGSIKVRIKTAMRRRAPQSGVRFLAKDTVRIRADMPWLERRLPSFEYSKDVEISYPCTFGNFNFLSTITQGAVSKVQYEVL